MIDFPLRVEAGGRRADAGVRDFGFRGAPPVVDVRDALAGAAVARVRGS